MGVNHSEEETLEKKCEEYQNSLECRDSFHKYTFFNINLENFILQAYKVYAGPYLLKDILRNVRSRIFFTEFVKSIEDKNEILTAIHSYLISNSLADDASKWNDSYWNIIYTRIDSDKKLGGEQVGRALRHFFCSEYYLNWRSEEYRVLFYIFLNYKHSYDVNGVSQQVNKDSPQPNEEDLREGGVMASQMGKVVFPGYCPVKSVIEAMDVIHMKKILASDIWLFNLLISMEDVPVSLTVSTPAHNNESFPLIYANKYFEVMSGYDRGRPDTLGKDMRFLQEHDLCDAHLERSACANIDTALQNKNQCIQVVKSFRKNGEVFSNYLHFKPITNERGKYVYVVSVQFDIGTSVSSINEARVLSESFMSTIPSCLKDEWNFRDEDKIHSKYVL
mmetsp:Transcript_25243/g.25471  ORF Transcript_25243/g.25471 Transcript_25243/m.25471 type:complete len:391 (-) Transcript_25243:61-1233(-)